MPVSGPAAPPAMRSSAARAIASDFSASTVMNALRLALKRAMRARCARVSSTEESSRFARRAARLRMVSACTSLDHFWNQVQAVLGRRRDGLVERALVAVGDDVLAQALACVLWMRHRLDAACVDRLHLVDQREDGVQLAAQMLDLVVRELDAREPRDAPDFFGGKHQKKRLRP